MFFQSRRKKRPKKAPQGTSREAKMTPGSAPREPRSGPRSPKTGPRAARSAPRAPKSRPKSASERPWRPPGAHLAPDSPPETSRRPFQSPSKRIPTLRGMLRKTSAKRCLLPGRLFGRQATAEEANATGNACCPGPRRDRSNSTVGLVRRRTADQ